MNLKTQIAKNLISKDFKLSDAAAGAFLNNCDIEAFKDLCENSEAIFDFVKEKINNNLLKNLDENNFKYIFEFSKIYCEDFEDFVVRGLVKFANEDLTDKVLKILETGTSEQKAYAAKYFLYIQDPIAIDALNSVAFDDFQPLAFNATKVLAKFDDRKLYNEAITILKNSEDDFEKIKMAEFLSTFGDRDSFPALFSFMQTSGFAFSVASLILDLIPLRDIKLKESLEIYDNILNAYPEFLSLESIIWFDLYNYIKKILNINEKNSYISHLLLKTKIKFSLFAKEDIYTFDLTKETKAEILKIKELIDLQNKNLEKDLEGELLSLDPKRIESVLETIAEEHLDYGAQIENLLNKSENEIIICKCVEVLKKTGKTFDKKIADKIKNKNIKALIEAYSD